MALALAVFALGFSIAAIRLSWALAGLADGVSSVLRVWLEKVYQDDPSLDLQVTDPIPEYILSWIDRESEEWAQEELRSQALSLYREHEDWDVAYRILASGHAGWGAELTSESESP